MTPSQISLLELEEKKRHNLEQEGIDKKKIKVDKTANKIRGWQTGLQFVSNIADTVAGLLVPNIKVAKSYQNVGLTEANVAKLKDEIASLQNKLQIADIKAATKEQQAQLTKELNQILREKFSFRGGKRK